MINGQNFFDQSIKNYLRTYHNIVTCQANDCTTDFLLDYSYLKKYYKLIGIDLSELQVLDADPKPIQ